MPAPALTLGLAPPTRRRTAVAIAVAAVALAIAATVGAVLWDSLVADATFALQHVDTAAAVPRFVNVTSFKVKLLNAYLAADVDNITLNNVGATQFVYENPACRGWFQPACGPSNAAWFELARPDAEVRAQLNAGHARLWPGTYRAVRAEFCRHGADAPIFRFTVGDGDPIDVQVSGAGAPSR